ncbi:MAG: hypothetical protein KF774_15485 [Planctomyces sp.]|nr:hypothetical protein [Planctomyces sp.]
MKTSIVAFGALELGGILAIIVGVSGLHVPHQPTVRMHLAEDANPNSSDACPDGMRLIEVISRLPASVDYPPTELLASDRERYREAVDEHWQSILVPAHAMFVDYLESTTEDRDQFLRIYLRTMLNARPQESYRLWLGGHDFLFPTSNYQYRGPTQQLQEQGARASVLLIAGDRELRTKHFRMAAWHSSAIHHPNSAMSSMESTFSHQDPADRFWWDTLSFSHLLIATGHDHLLDGLDDTNVRTRFQQWKAWLDEHQGRLAPSSAGPIWVINPGKPHDPEAFYFPQLRALPSLPTYEWEGPLPLIPGDLNSIEEGWPDRK